MKVNKKALYALAAYYRVLPSLIYNGIKDYDVVTQKDRNQIKVEVWLNVVDVEDKALFRAITHAEVFFRAIKEDKGFFCHQFTYASLAKLLRYIARNGKFPRNNSLRYV